MSSLEGTVLWICKSPVRPGHKRKNWYVDVSIIPEKDEIPLDADYRIEKFHSGGKGDQNVNKVETGVRVIHIPTGITASSTQERSQYLNSRKRLHGSRGSLPPWSGKRGSGRRTRHGRNTRGLSVETLLEFMRARISGEKNNGQHIICRI